MYNGSTRVVLGVELGVLLGVVLRVGLGDVEIGVVLLFKDLWL